VVGGPFPLARLFALGGNMIRASALLIVQEAIRLLVDPTAEGALLPVAWPVAGIARAGVPFLVCLVPRCAATAPTGRA
jgi:hypothetical protein